MQRSWNKYSPQFIYNILEFLDDSSTAEDLLAREKYFIDILHPDLNLKLDPTTEKRCLTIIKPVYQFDLFGNLIKRWDSIMDAAESLKIDSSNIIHVCSGHQRHTKNFLWSYSEKLEIKPIGIYVFSLSGELLAQCNNTVEVYEKFFPNKNRKNVLSQLKGKINSNIPYTNIFLSTDKNFCPLKKDYFYRGNNELYEFFKKNPYVYIYKSNGDIRSNKRLREHKDSPRIMNFIRNNIDRCTFTEDSVSYRLVEKTCKIQATKIETGEIKVFDSIYFLIEELFDGNYELKSAIWHHARRHTPYKGYYISKYIGTSIKPSELLETLEDDKTETELETINGIV